MSLLARIKQKVQHVTFLKNAKTWDAEERLKTAGNGSFSNAYAYNGLDQRTDKADSTGTFSYLREDDDIASPVLSDGAATYNYGAGLVSEVRGGTSKFYQSDALGSTRELTNASGSVTNAHETDAFGNTVAASGSTATPFGFAGQAGYQSDADTGLKLLGHRYYDSSTGRFLSRDPIRDGHNWYAYCGNDPVNGFDPDGQSWVSIAFGAVVGIGVGVLTANPLLGVAAGFTAGTAASHWGEGNDLGAAAADGAAAGLIAGELIPIGIGMAAANGLYGNCFVAGTTVQMADGSTKAVEQIKAGDSVATKDQHDKADGDRSGKIQGVTSGKVLRTFVHKDAQTLVLSFDNGEKITTTLGHPFFVAGKGWTLSGQLAIGNSIVSRAGPAAKITNIELGETAIVYNFEVGSTHTYFVGKKDGGLWVHNMSSLTPGENLGGPMAGSPYTPTQKGVVADKVNNMAADMAERGFQKPDIRNPLVMTGDGIIVSGHHRVVAAHLSGTPIPEEYIIRLPATQRVPRPWGDVTAE